MAHLRLGVNIDHVATLRNARGEAYPDPVRAAQLAAEAGANGITAHLREDRRHIIDQDIVRLKEEIDLPLNMEMAATQEMLAIALKVKPHAVCLVPEKREEVTTEGGLDVVALAFTLKEYVTALSEVGCRVSLFVDAKKSQIEMAKEMGAHVVELHTGAYCHKQGQDREAELQAIIESAKLAEALALECHAGHGLTFDNVASIAAIPQVVELNIGHFLVGESVFLGLKEAIIQMRKLMDHARQSEVV